ncbi:hypothetical protein J2Z69_002682 [Paenibacillus shirakamiensis]|uniref:SWIM-type domain-containing protein n=1 Tax=Paenibacillus shirakamiensis TaxID=1265935 RepID=A0ABS4JIV2_9BACL|nr:hypothetical protein [Paenibacillus shirakamiensis]
MKRLAALLPETPPWAAAPGAPLGACSCGRAGCAHVAAAAELAAAHWAQQPLLRLSALGLAPERLQAAVFAAWAAAAPPGAAELPEAAYGGDTGRALREGPGLAEWLAEAAEQDRMHVPGPQFHDVKVNLTSAGLHPGLGTAAPDARDWAQLLPGVPGAAAAVARIAARASERSQEQAETVNRRTKAPSGE